MKGKKLGFKQFLLPFIIIKSIVKIVGVFFFSFSIISRAEYTFFKDKQCV